MILANALDRHDGRRAGTEHGRGWLSIEDGLIAEVGAGDAAGSGPRTSAARSSRRGSSTPTTTSTRRSRARGRRRPTSSRWLRTLYPVWARIDEEMEYAAARTGLAELALVGLLDRLRPPLRLPARRRAAWSRPRCAPRASSACASSPRAGRWTSASPTAACRPTSWSRSIDASSPTPSGSPRSPTATACRSPSRRARRSRSTTRLMEESAALARRLGLVLHTHLAETLEEDAYCRELYGCTPVEYLERVGWLAERRLVRALRPPLRAGGRAVRGARRRRRPLPDLEPAARRGRRTGPRAARRRGPGRARRRRLGVERARRPLPRGEAGAARRPRSRRPDGDERARGAAARHPGRRRGPPPRRHRLARARQACRPRGLADRRARARRRRRLRRRPRPLRPAPRRPAPRRRPSDVVRDGAARQRATRRRSRASTASRLRGSGR